MNAKFCENILHVGTNGVRRQVEVLGDVGPVVPGGEEDQHLLLSAAEQREGLLLFAHGPGRLLKSPEDLGEQLGGNPALPSVDATDGLDEALYRRRLGNEAGRASPDGGARRLGVLVARQHDDLGVRALLSERLGQLDPVTRAKVYVDEDHVGIHRPRRPRRIGRGRHQADDIDVGLRLQQRGHRFHEDPMIVGEEHP